MSKVYLFKKERASRAFGRGQDNVYVPAQYQIIVDGKIAGHIIGSDSGFMEGVTWTVTRLDTNNIPRPIKMFYASSGKPFARAKDYAINEINWDKPLSAPQGSQEVKMLTGDIWNRMTPFERDQLGIKAKLDAETRGERWIGLWPAEKRALIREYKKEQGASNSFANRRVSRRTPRITPKTPRLRR